MIALLARRLRRQKSQKSQKRKLFRKPQEKDMPPDFASITQEIIPPIIEKSNAEDVIHPLANVIAIPQCLPPTYDECIQNSPVVSTEIAIKHGMLDRQAKFSTLEATEPSRGRSTQILYRSQLSGLAKRRSVRRPSPIHKRINTGLCGGVVNDILALRIQYYVLSWWKHLGMLQAAFFLFLVGTGILLALGY